MDLTWAQVVLLVASYAFLAAQDNVVAWYWAARVGPRRARDETLRQFKDPATASEVRAALDIPDRTDLRTMQTAIKRQVELVTEAVKSAIADETRIHLAPLKSAIADLERKVDHKLDLFETRLDDANRQVVGATRDFRVPDAEVDRVVKSFQAAVRRTVTTPEMLEGVGKLLDERLERLKRSDANVEDLLEEAEMADPENQQKVYDWLLAKGLPEPIAFRAVSKGPKVIRLIAEKKGWDWLEVLQ